MALLMSIFKIEYFRNHRTAGQQLLHIITHTIGTIMLQKLRAQVRQVFQPHTLKDLN